MQLSPDDLVHIDRELAKRSLIDFCKMSWHVLEPSTPLKWGWAMDAICEHLEAITNGTLDRHLCMNVPAGSMKSLLVNVFWPCWEWGPKDQTHLRHITTAHEEGLAIRDTRKARLLIKSEWFQRRWVIELDSSSDGKREFGNNDQGFMLARSFTSMTGRRGDRVKLDDPISAFHANSKAHIEAARVAFLETLPTRVNNENSRIVVVMQRLNANDITGVILERELDYEHLVIPMRYELGAKRSISSIGFKDPRSREGELMFPQRFAEKQVAELEKTLGTYGVAGQLQQRPTTRGGQLFKDSWWGYYNTTPALEYRAIYADTASKTATRNDYSVLQCWGKTLDGRAVLIDQMRGKWESPELRKMAKTFWTKQKHDPAQNIGQLRTFNVEDASSGTGLIQELKRAPDLIPMKAITRIKDKVTRAHDASPSVEAGLVLLPENAVFLSDFVTEVQSFPNGAHDDQVDPMLDAINDMLAKTQPKPRIRSL
jgi:predicted phage terminase large subunit-like protein